MLGADSRAAWAGYGPAGGAIRSNLPLTQFEVEDWLELTPRKLKQRAESVSLDRSRDLVKQINEELEVKKVKSEELDALILKLQEEAPDALLTEELTMAKEAREASAREKELAAQLQERVTLLERLDQQPNWVVYGSALCAAFGSTTVMHPVDTYKTLMMSGEGERSSTLEGSPQQQHGEHEGASPGAGVAGALAIVPKLYRGVSANLLKEVPPSAVYLGVYEAAKTTLLAGSLASNPLLVYLISGGCGEFVGSFLRAPSEAVKARVQSGQAESTGEAFGQLMRNPQMRLSLVSTWATSLARDVPFGGIQIAVFELTKTMIVQNPDIKIDPNTLAAEIALGALGGLIGSLLTAPIDVVIVRLITQTSTPAEGTDGPFDMAKRIYEEEGLGGFLNGAVARGVYWTPAIGIFLGLYCSLRKMALTMMV